MGKYEPLSDLLSSRAETTWTANFGEIEKVLGFKLPRSARTYREWWANQREGSGHSQSKGWQDAGWQVWRVDIENETVTFKRRDGPLQETTADRTEALFKEAERITGTNDRRRVIENALQALIEREAIRHLIAMGGTAPDYEAPPRERPAA